MRLQRSANVVSFFIHLFSKRTCCTTKVTTSVHLSF
uniref:Uncharacterized protein n=1 Tax=Anguilla anguilla TaxID=7936 RepID=A0A0E9W7D1_ANGAN